MTATQSFSRSLSLWIHIQNSLGYRIGTWPEKRVRKAGPSALSRCKLREAPFASFGLKWLSWGPWYRCRASPLGQAAAAWISDVRLERELWNRTGRGRRSASQTTRWKQVQTTVWVLQDCQKMALGLGSRQSQAGSLIKVAWAVFSVLICSWNKGTQKPHQIANQEVTGQR